LRFKLFSSLLLSLFLSVALIAQEAPDPPRLSDEIIVTATGLRETVEETPAAATVITRDEIEAAAADDLATVLREVPGVILARAGSDGKQTSLFTRGGNSNHTLVLWNGIDLNRPYFAGFDWGTFSTAGVERVEVVRGPYSALYGSDAVSGVINVISEPAGDLLNVDFRVGENSLARGLVEVGGSSTDLSWYLAADSLTDDGFDANDDRRQDSASAAVNWNLAAASSLGLRARYSAFDLGIPFNTNADSSALVPSLQRRQEGTEYQIAVPLRAAFGRLSFDAVASRSVADDRFSDPDDPYGLFESDTDSTVDAFRLTTTLESKAFGTVVAGGEIERATVDASSSYGVSLDDDRRDSTAFFIEDRITRDLGIGFLEVSAGARYDDYDTFGSELSPRVATAFRRGGSKFRAAYGEAFRAPSVGELYYPFFGNPDLEAETVRSVEAGYDHLFRNRGSISVTLFRSSFDKLITTSTTDFILRNIDRAESEGFELGGRLQAASFSLALAYTYANTENRATGAELLRRPKHSGSVTIGHNAGRLDTMLVILHTGERTDLIPIAPFSVVSNEAHTTADLTLRYRSGEWAPYLRVENLTDERYEEVLGFEGGGRRALIGVRYSLQ
jgi:vitamin B12 transporter